MGYKNTVAHRFAEFYKSLDEKVNKTKAAKMFCEQEGIKYTDSQRSRFAKVLNRLDIVYNKKPIEKSKDFIAAKKRKVNKSKYYIITAAQNATPVHKKFLENMIAYQNKIDAELLIIASRYRNPTSVFTDKGEDWWSQEVKPYLTAKRSNLHNHLQLLADIKINPTAATPLSGLNGISGIESCIIGHPRVHLSSLPVLDGYPKKILATTGFCTVKNYTDSKAGKKGEFNHNFGFIIVEIKNNKIFYIRQVVADKDGNFYDLKNKVFDGKVTKNTEAIPAIVLGDIHLGNHDEKALDASLQIAEDYKAKHVILHDLFDGYSVNPHEKKSPFVLAQKEFERKLGLDRELAEMSNFLSLPFNFVVVRSNHDEFLDRFLNDSDWRKERNKKIYLELAHKKASGEMPDGVIPYYVRQAGHKALGINDSFMLNNCELALHGHIGASGSRGSANQFKKLNVKTITGHTHSPIRIDGHCSVGTLSKLRQGYNKGLSSWLHCNVIIQPDGSRQHIILINGKHTTFKNC